MLSSSKELASWLGKDIPEAYGGTGNALSEGSNSVHVPKNDDGEANAAVEVAAPEVREVAPAVEEAELAAPDVREVAPVSEEAELAASDVREVAPVAEEAEKAEPVAEAKATEGAVPIVNNITPAETAAEEPKVAEIPVTAVPEIATPAVNGETETPKLEETPVSEEITPLPLTEPGTADVVVTEAATQPIVEVEVREDAPGAPKDIAEVPIPAPTTLTEAPKVEEKKE